MADEYIPLDARVTEALGHLMGDDVDVERAKGLLLAVVQDQPANATLRENVIVNPTPDQIVAAVRTAKSLAEAEGFVFVPVQEWDDAAKTRGIRVIVRAAWMLAQQFPQAKIGLEHYGGASGADFNGDRFSPDIILVGDGGPGSVSYDVLVAAAEPAAQLGAAVAPGDWRAPINPVLLPPVMGQQGIPDAEVDRMLALLSVRRAGYGPTMTNEECIELLDDVAFRLGSWGVLSKPQGNNARRRDGVLCSVDFIVYRPTVTGMDVLASAGGGGPSTPNEGDMEPFTLDRFVPAIGLADGPGGPIDPPPPPVDPTVLDLLHRIDRKTDDLLKLHNDLIVAIGNALVESGQHIAEEIARVEKKLDRGYLGTARLPVFGTITFDLRPKPE